MKRTLAFVAAWLVVALLGSAASAAAQGVQTGAIRGTVGRDGRGPRPCHLMGRDRWKQFAKPANRHRSSPAGSPRGSSPASS